MQQKTRPQKIIQNRYQGWASEIRGWSAEAFRNASTPVLPANAGVNAEVEVFGSKIPNNEGPFGGAPYDAAIVTCAANMQVITVK
jgi:hypothetical protein